MKQEQDKRPDSISLSGTTLDVYGNKLNESLQSLSLIFQKDMIGTPIDSKAIQYYLKRLKNSLECLRMKYRYSDRGLEIDSTDSGFPTYYEFSLLWVDSESAEEKQAHLLPQSVIKRKMVDHFFSEMSDNPKLLSQMADRVYYDTVSTTDIFFPMNLGELMKVGENSYVFHWATFDSRLNTPFVYVMSFETSYDEAFHLSQDIMKEFIEVIKFEGAPTRKLNLTAMSIDEKLPYIHPKILKRFSLGPFYAEDIVTHVSGEINDLLSTGQPGRRFLMKLGEETIFSAKQQQKTGFLSIGKKVEIFYLPADKPLLRNKGISSEGSYVILPYELHQNSRGLFHQENVFSFDTKGNIVHV